MTKTLFTAILLVTSLGGCTKLPGTPAPEVERVMTVHHNGPIVHATPAPKATVDHTPEGPLDIVGVHVEHGTSVAGDLTVRHVPVAAPAPENVQAAGSASGTTGTSTFAATTAVPGTDTPQTVSTTSSADQPSLSIVSSPNGTYRAFPVVVGGKVVSAEVSPSKAKLTWQVEATHGRMLVSKVKIAIADGNGQNVVEASQSPDALKWPVSLDGQQALSLPLNTNLLVAFLQKAPMADHAVMTVSLQGAAGEPLVGEDGNPFQLGVTMSVL